MTRHRLWLVAFWLAVLAGITASLWPGPQLPDPWFRGADKLQHALAYAMLFLLGRQAGYRSNWGLPLALLALGGAIELAQGTFTVTRSAEWLDGLADAVGIAVGRWLALWAERQRADSTGLKQVNGR
ncbi:MAG TPA: VanZ family protein [Burkholderiaceae bacterium]|nr:VanZ family protein [Burkholderiaceae bacterium]